MKRMIESVIGAIIVIGWMILFSWAVSALGNKSYTIELCSIIAGASAGLFVTFGVQFFTSELKKK